MAVIKITMNVINVIKVIRVTTLASAAIGACLTQADDTLAPYGSIIDKKLCYAHAL